MDESHTYTVGATYWVEEPSCFGGVKNIIYGHKRLQCENLENKISQEGKLLLLLQWRCGCLILTLWTRQVFVSVRGHQSSKSESLVKKKKKKKKLKNGN